MEKLLDFLEKKYNVDDVQFSGPFLILRSDEIPPQDMRPFTIGGCLAVWLTRTQPMPRELQLGSRGLAAKCRLNEDEASDMKPYHLPSSLILRSVWDRLFPDAEAITFLTTGLIIEMPATDRDSFLEKLHSLPSRFENSGVTLDYHNGLLVADELKRRKEPQPRVLDGECDDTDYVKAEKCFFPGSMLKSGSGAMVSAGVVIQKAQVFRVTAAFRCWSDEYDGNEDKLGDEGFMTVRQGVGNIQERIGKTDIGLVKLQKNIKFNNRFLGIDTTPKAFIPISKVNYKDEFVIDGFTTSVQRLTCFGTRVRKCDARTEDLYQASSNVELPSTGRYVLLNQGIYATGCPEIKGTPRIREGVCGSALLRVDNAKGDDFTTREK